MTETIEKQSLWVCFLDPLIKAVLSTVYNNLTTTEVFLDMGVCQTFLQYQVLQKSVEGHLEELKCVSTVKSLTVCPASMIPSFTMW